MIDRILLKSKYEVTMTFWNRSPITIFSSEGLVLDLLFQITSNEGRFCTFKEIIYRRKKDEDNTVALVTGRALWTSL